MQVTLGFRLCAFVRKRDFFLQKYRLYIYIKVSKFDESCRG